MRKEWMMLTVGCLLLAGCAGARPFELDASYYQDSAPIVNDNQNVRTNQSFYHQRYGLARSGDAVYLKTFEVRSRFRLFPLAIGDYWNETIYRFDANGGKKIYAGEQTTGAEPRDISLPFYDGKLLDFNYEQNYVAPTLRYLNEATGSYEELMTIRTPDNSALASFEVLGGTLYLFTEGNHVYAYRDGSYEPLHLDGYGAQSSVLGMSDHELLYCETREESPWKLRPVSYDLDRREIAARYDLSPLADVFSDWYLNGFNATPHYFYLSVCKSYDSSYGKQCLFRVRRSDLQTVQLAEYTGDMLLNTCGGCAFLSYLDETPGLYMATPDSDTLTRLYDGEVRSINIIDDTWVFFTNENNDLYRILPDGGQPVKVGSTE